MKRLKVNLVLLAFLGAALSAFTFAKPASNVTLFGRVTAPNGAFIRWEQVSPNYDCDQAQGTCVAQLKNDDPMLGEPIEGTQTEGKYIP